MLSISLQAKIFGAYFTVLSGCTDQRPENIKALQLPFCSQPVKTLTGIDTVSPVPIYAYFNSRPKKDSISSPCKPSLTLQTQKKLSVPSKNFRQAKDNTFLHIQHWQSMGGVGVGKVASNPFEQGY